MGVTRGRRAQRWDRLVTDSGELAEHRDPEMVRRQTRPPRPPRGPVRIPRGEGSEVQEVSSDLERVQPPWATLALPVDPETTPLGSLVVRSVIDPGSGAAGRARGPVPAVMPKGLRALADPRPL